MGEWMKGKVRTLSLALPLYGEGVHPEGLLPIKGEMPKGQRGSVPLFAQEVKRTNDTTGRYRPFNSYLTSL